ncbi:MAG: transcription termination/antitermination protein NusG [Candidatus Eisenbacteria bacterium]
MTKKWYVIHTYSGHENKVRANLDRAIQYAQLQDRFGEILVATENFAVLKDGKKTITRRKTFPGYVLVEMDLTEETKHLVTSIPGVTHFVGNEKNPMPLSETEINRIRGHATTERERITAEVPFKVGESVKVIDGPFCDFVGTVDEINTDRGKVRVMVSIFGRATPVELDFLQVQTI